MRRESALNNRGFGRLFVQLIPRVPDGFTNLTRGLVHAGSEMALLAEVKIVFATLDEIIRARRSDIGYRYKARSRNHAWELAIGLYKKSSASVRQRHRTEWR